MKGLNQKTVLLAMMLLFSQLIYSQVPICGTYTIGGTSPDFITVGDAATAINDNGICGPIVFNIRTGTYIEQVTIHEIVGATEINTITFQSESSDSSDVLITYFSNDVANNFTIKLDGVDYITFKNLTLKSLGTTYSRVIELANGANSNQFLNNRIEGVSTTSYSEDLAMVYSGQGLSANENNNNTVLKNNIISGGSYGLCCYGYSTIVGEREKNLIVENNSFENQYSYGIYLKNQEIVQIEANDIYTASSSFAFRGLYAYYTYDSIQIIGNKISMQNGRAGISFYRGYGSIGNECVIANNFVVINGKWDSAWGIALEYCYYYNVFHNTVNVAVTESDFTYAMNISSGNNINLMNNIFSNTGDGYAIALSYSEVVASSDYNNFYAKGNHLAYIYNSLVDLSAWQSFSGLDANSISIDPRFVSETDLHVREIALYNTGSDSTLSFVDKDIDGELRGAAPDIGADEFTPAIVDVGAYAVACPQMPFEAGVQMVSAIIKNSGLGTLNSVELHWSVNDSVQRFVNWNGGLVTSDTTIAQLGTYTFNPYTVYNIKIWTENPNGGADVDLSNDTVTVVRYAGLEGIYTIGGADPDFNTFTDAVAALSNGGVLGPAVFNVRNGSFNEQVVIPEIIGTSATNTITFQSESGDSTAVTLYYNSIDKNINYTLSLAGADYITFKNLTLQALNGTYGRVVVFGLGADNNQFLNNRLESVSTNSTSTYMTVVDFDCYYVEENNNNTVIKNNIILNGSSGIYYDGYSTDYGKRAENLLIENNRFENQSGTSVFLRDVENAQVKNNTIATNSLLNTYIGIYAYFTNHSIQVIGNKMSIQNGGYGIYFTYVDGLVGKECLIANNFVDISGVNVDAYGIYLKASDYCNVYHNTVNITTTQSTATYALNISGGTGYYLTNNIFANSGDGYAIYAAFISGLVSSDYNNFYAKGDNLAFLTENLADLSAWQTATEMDQHSISVDPVFYSNTDLHVYNSQLDAAATPLTEVTDDIDGNIRSSTPDIGADEFIPPTEDASVTNIDAPVNIMTVGYNDVYVQLLNNATAELNSVSIYWTVNGNGQPTYNWGGVLAPEQSDSVKIGTYNFLSDTEYEIVAWSHQPNGLDDKIQINDTASVSGLFTGMLGVYVIGGVDADYPNFTQAVQALDIRGVAGNVVFKITDSIYNEQVTINEIEGLSDENRITFESVSGDSSSVTLNYPTTLSGDYTLWINGADYIDFKNMTISTSGSYDGKVVRILNNSSYLNFNNVVFNGATTNSSIDTTNRAIIYASAQNQFNTFTNCKFNDGSYAFYYIGESSNILSSGTIIGNNIFEDQTHAGIYLVNQSKPKVYNNSIVTYSTYTLYSGIYFSYCDSSFAIENNKISANGGGYGINIQYSDGLLNNEGRIINNFINVGGAGTAYGIYTSTSGYSEVYHNNVSISSTDVISGRAYYNTG